ncbi:hypothetical protein DK867_11505 [Ochrobactrum sp. POC9]|nr:hypothetical protein [Ochrobactrum sp. A-1]PWU73488.1 hypothetical protein DK867_11505 [Ochrobactrum sp. POC9]
MKLLFSLLFLASTMFSGANIANAMDMHSKEAAPFAGFVCLADDNGIFHCLNKCVKDSKLPWWLQLGCL